MGDATERERVAAIVQEILSGIPDAGGTWLLPVHDADGSVVDFRLAATGVEGLDLYNRGITRRNARLSELYPSMVGGPLWQVYLRVLADGGSDHLPDFRYQDNTAGIVAESHFDVSVHATLGGLLVWWRRVDEDRHRMERTEMLGRLGWADYDLATGASQWSAGMYRIFERDTALGPMSQAEQGAALLTEDRGLSETAWQTLDSGAASDVTVRFRFGATVKHVRILSDVSRDADGTPLKIHAVVQDVTSREDSRTEIHRLRDQLQTREMTALAEHRLAAQLQNMIQPLPAGSVRLPGLETMVGYLPAESALQVGGDWYHMQELPDGRTVLAIGDVAGHGLEAANGMAHLRYSLAAWLSIDICDPAMLLGHLNRMCVDLRITGTAVVATYDPAEKLLHWSRAGHMPPLRARASAAEPLSAPAGLLLGADRDAAYSLGAADLRADDLLLFYTDGLVERRDASGLAEGVRRTLADASASVDDQTVGRLVSRLSRPSPYDDTCMLLARVLG
ncbi:MAG TPA: SpoIIE family protein phosphatase [Micromonosporaceae bacterium]|jgi:serine phosphatase RsbU (regulator of sigma subunit)